MEPRRGQEEDDIERTAFGEVATEVARSSAEFLRLSSGEARIMLFRRWTNWLLCRDSALGDLISDTWPPTVRLDLAADLRLAGEENVRGELQRKWGRFFSEEASKGLLRRENELSAPPPHPSEASLFSEDPQERESWAESIVQPWSSGPTRRRMRSTRPPGGLAAEGLPGPLPGRQR